MILVRISDGNRVIVKGDVNIPGYRDWFIATSIDFGVGRKIEASEDSDQDIEVGQHETQELSIDKTTNSATVYLMQLAMKSRSQGASSQPLAVDIHLVEPKANLDGTIDPNEPVMAYLQIRIENAIVQGWKLDASGDDRPSESVSIWFNKAAIKYYASADGKSFIEYGPVGWDQYGNQDFRPNGM